MMKVYEDDGEESGRRRRKGKKNQALMVHFKILHTYMIQRFLFKINEN